MPLNIILCLIGFVLLYYGAHWLVKGAGSLAAQMGISPLVIGLSVVAVGTSIPEILVSVIAAFGGQSMMAVGNVVGSNICNMALGLGLAACFFPIAAHGNIVRRDMPVMLLTFVIVLVFMANGVVGRLEGVVLVVLLVVYLTAYYLLAAKKGADPKAIEVIEESLDNKSSHAKQLMLIALGVIGLALGAKLTVDAASNLMLALGVSERLVGLTIVAVGTSLPELITSVVAAAKKESAISLGNIIGSNVFNLFGALGLAAVFAPVVIPNGFFTSGGVWVDYLVMFVFCALPCALMWKSGVMARKGGLLLVVLYVIYVIWLIMTQGATPPAP